MHRRRSACELIFFLLLSFAACTSASHSEDQTHSYYPIQSFDAFSGGELNISSFVFRDVNRSASFDLGDRPLAHIAVEMIRPDGSRLVRRSNVSGFANFEMSVLNRDADILDEGHYRFGAKIPANWELTTGNAEQDRSFRVLPGAPGDLVSPDSADPIGFAPVLTVSGQLVAIEARSAPSLRAITPAGDTQEIPVGAQGEFSFTAEPGEWTLEAQFAAGAAGRRRVQVEQSPVVLSRTSFASREPDPAPVEETVTFDELIGTNAVAKVPSGVGGVEWRNWVVAHNRFYSGEGYVNATTSGEFVGYNGSGHPAELASDVPFDFVGGHLGAAWSAAEGEILQVRGWRHSDLVYDDRLELSALGPVYFSADYRAVTRVEFATEHYWQFVADDLTFRLHE